MRRMKMPLPERRLASVSEMLLLLLLIGITVHCADNTSIVLQSLTRSNSSSTTNIYTDMSSSTFGSDISTILVCFFLMLRGFTTTRKALNLNRSVHPCTLLLMWLITGELVLSTLPTGCYGEILV